MRWSPVPRTSWPRGAGSRPASSSRCVGRSAGGPGLGSTTALVPQLATMADALAELVESIPEAILRAPGGEGDWNVAQCIGHTLRVAGRPVHGRFACRRWTLAGGRTIGRPGDPGRTGWRPASCCSARSPRASGSWSGRPRAVDGHETEPCPLDHPQVGRLRCGEWLLFAGVHDLMHVDQVHELLDRSGG